jgi:hypothetical protein
MIGKYAALGYSEFYQSVGTVGLSVIVATLGRVYQILGSQG